MSFNLSNLLNILFYIALGYIFSKTLGPAIWEWLYEKFTGRKIKKGESLDDMIARKKRSLSNKSTNELLSAPSKKLRDKESSKLDLRSVIQKNIQKEKSESKKEDYKKIIELLDSLQWGDGKEIQSIKKSFEDSTKLTIESTLVTRTLRELDQNDFFVKFKKRPLSFEDFSSITQSVILLDLLENESSLDGLSKHLKTDSRTLKNSMRIMLYAKDKAQRSTAILNITQDLEAPIFDNSPTNSIYYKFLSSLKSFRPKAIIQKLKVEIDLLRSITPLDDISNKDGIDKACKILEIDQGLSLEDMKLLYRKLAKRYHPDTLSGAGVPSEALDIASQNFTKIKIAYEVFKEHKK